MDTLSSEGQLITSTDIIIGGVLRFLDQRATEHVKNVSTEWQTSVDRVKQDLFLWYQKVEALCNGRLDLGFDAAHDWARSYEIASTVPVALYYAENEIDEKIAQAIGAETLRGKGRGQFVDEMATLARQGHLAAFQVMLDWGCARDKFKPASLERFIAEAFQGNSVQILQLPRIVKAIKDKDMADIHALESIFECDGIANVSPITLDFFLSSCSPVNQDCLDSCAYDWIQWGYDGLVRVLLRKGLLFPWRTRNCESYGGCDGSEGYDWSPLWLAAKLGRTGLVRAFLQAPRENGKQLGVLGAALMAGYVGTVAVLLESGTFFAQPCHLAAAAHQGRIEIVRLLLTYPSCLPLTDDGLLTSVVMDDHTEIALMLSPHVTISSDERTKLLSIAKYNDNRELEKALRSTRVV